MNYIPVMPSKLPVLKLGRLIDLEMTRRLNEMIANSITDFKTGQTITEYTSREKTGVFSLEKLPEKIPPSWIYEEVKHQDKIGETMYVVHELLSDKEQKQVAQKIISYYDALKPKEDNTTMRVLNSNEYARICSENQRIFPKTNGSKELLDCNHKCNIGMYSPDKNEYEIRSPKIEEYDVVARFTFVKPDTESSE